MQNAKGDDVLINQRSDIINKIKVSFLLWSWSVVLRRWCGQMTVWRGQRDDQHCHSDREPQCLEMGTEVPIRPTSMWLVQLPGGHKSIGDPCFCVCKLVKRSVWWWAQVLAVQGSRCSLLAGCSLFLSSWLGNRGGCRWQGNGHKPSSA